MLFILGSVLAGVMFYDYLTEHERENNHSSDRLLGHKNEQEWVKKSCVHDGSTSVIYRIKRGDSELSLPPCKLMGVELGPSNNIIKATLQVMMSNKSVKKEYKPVKGIDKEVKYVELTPTQYHTNIVLGVKEKYVVPITAYYRT